MPVTTWTPLAMAFSNGGKVDAVAWRRTSSTTTVAAADKLRAAAVKHAVHAPLLSTSRAVRNAGHTARNSVCSEPLA